MEVLLRELNWFLLDKSAVFLKLLNMSITVGWMVLAVILLRILLIKAPKWITGVLWSLVALRLIFPFSIESAYSLIPSVNTFPERMLDSITPEIESGLPAVDVVINPMLQELLPAQVQDFVEPFHDVTALCTLIWILGMSAMLAYAVISYFLLRARVSTATRVFGNVKQSEKVNSPFVLGILHPTIYLPLQMNDSDRKFVIEHEQAHIHRLDHLWKPLGFLLLSVYWFNPLLWVAYILFSRDIERASDEKAVKFMQREERRAYAEALLNCSIHRRSITACPLAFGEVGVKNRIRNVMNYKKPAIWFVAISAAVCVFFGAAFLTNPPTDRSFSMDGMNISELDPQKIMDQIRKIEGLGDSEPLYVHKNYVYQLPVTPNFDWLLTQLNLTPVNDGAPNNRAITFFFSRDGEEQVSALQFDFQNAVCQVSQSHAVNTERNQYIQLEYFLEALKYLPQDEIRRLTPNADGYMVDLYMYMQEHNPGYRTVFYTKNGIEETENWVIRLSVQPYYRDNDYYYSVGGETIYAYYCT